MAKDFLNKEIKIGDKVVFMQKNYRNFIVGKIIHLTEKTAIIEHEKQECNGNIKKTKQFHNQLIKIE